MRRLTLTLLLSLLGTGLVQAHPGEDGHSHPHSARIAIIIDDLGDHWGHASRALELPGVVTYAVLPRTPYARRVAEQAHNLGREVMLHLPMESRNGWDLGPGGLTTAMDEGALRQTLYENLQSVPHARGINNHMGSRLTRNRSSMSQLMQALADRGGLYFVDSRTTSGSVAALMAAEKGVPFTGRDLFIDNSREPSAIRTQLQQLLAVALKHGDALAIGHPYDETLAELETFLPQLAMHGVQLVPVSRMIEQRSPQLWQASLSPSPRAAKSSKP